MKKTLAILCCLVVAVTGIVLTGCGGDKYADSPYVGTWNATVAETSGMELKVKDVLGEFKLTNEADGSCTVVLKGDESKGTWEPTEKGFTVDDGQMEFVSAGKDEITVEYSGVVIHFEKE